MSNPTVTPGRFQVLGKQSQALILAVDEVLVALSSKSALPGIIRPSVLPDLRHLYFGTHGFMLPIPAIPIVTEDFVTIQSIELGWGFSGKDYIPKKQIKAAAEILDQVQQHPILLPDCIDQIDSEEYLSPVVIDDQGKKYHYLHHGGARKKKVTSMVEGSAYAMDKALPIPSELHDLGLDYLQKLFDLGRIPHGMMYHEDGFSYFGD